MIGDEQTVAEAAGAIPAGRISPICHEMVCQGRELADFEIAKNAVATVFDVPADIVKDDLESEV